MVYQFCFEVLISYSNIQANISDSIYEDKTSLISNASSIAAIGVVLYVIIEIPTGIFNFSSPVWHIVSKGCILTFVVIAIIYFMINKAKKEK